jgi:hypothetical protein
MGGFGSVVIMVVARGFGWENAETRDALER